jgi:hypothetical protein
VQGIVWKHLICLVWYVFKLYHPKPWIKRGESGSSMRIIAKPPLPLFVHRSSAV